MEIFPYNGLVLSILSNDLRSGFVILIIGLIMVFLALISLFVVFKYLVPFALKDFGEKIQVNDPPTRSYVSGEEIAAASAAIYLFLNEVHDEENTIITIHRSKKEYSPWSSKIYSTHHIKSTS